MEGIVIRIQLDTQWGHGGGRWEDRHGVAWYLHTGSVQLLVHVKLHGSTPEPHHSCPDRRDPLSNLMASLPLNDIEKTSPDHSFFGRW